MQSQITEICWVYQPIWSRHFASQCIPYSIKLLLEVDEVSALIPWSNICILSWTLLIVCSLIFLNYQIFQSLFANLLMLLIILVEVSEIYNPRSMIRYCQKHSANANNIYIDTESSHKYSANSDTSWLTAKKYVSSLIIH